MRVGHFPAPRDAGARCHRPGLAARRLGLHVRAAPPTPPPRPTASGRRGRSGASRLLPPTSEPASALGYDGTTPGPLLRLRAGEALKVRLVNRLAAPTTLGWPGLRMPNAMAGIAGLTPAGGPGGRALRLSLHAARFGIQPLPAGGRRGDGGQYPARAVRAGRRRGGRAAGLRPRGDRRAFRGPRGFPIRRERRGRRCAPTAAARRSPSAPRPAPGCDCGSPTPATPASWSSGSRARGR